MIELSITLTGIVLAVAISIGLAEINTTLRVGLKNIAIVIHEGNK